MKLPFKFNFRGLRNPFSINPQITGWILTIVSVLLCALLSWSRLPGTEIAGVGVNWFVVWVVVWSLKRSQWSAAIAGVVLGLIQDGLTKPEPTHVLPLVVVGVLTAKIQKERFVQEEFVSAALIVFVMALVNETVMAIQFSFMPNGRSLLNLWSYHPLIALSSAILSSLWTPVLYFPLNRIWHWMGEFDPANHHLARSQPGSWSKSSPWRGR
jgi:rod shape-determining protein MreD